VADDVDWPKFRRAALDQVQHYAPWLLALPAAGSFVNVLVQPRSAFPAVGESRTPTPQLLQPKVAGQQQMRATWLTAAASQRDASAGPSKHRRVKGAPNARALWRKGDRGRQGKRHPGGAVIRQNAPTVQVAPSQTDVGQIAIAGVDKSGLCPRETAAEASAQGSAPLPGIGGLDQRQSSKRK
jgi:hypothetical protein